MVRQALKKQLTEYLIINEIQILKIADLLRKRRCFSIAPFDPRANNSLTTNGINNLPFVLSLSKDLFSVSLNTNAHVLPNFDPARNQHPR